jgi:hypothetical protein
MVFLGSSCRETAKNAIKKIDGKRRQEKSFLKKGFDMDFPEKAFDGVFELPLLRNAQKRHKRKSQKKLKKRKGTYLPHLVAICQIYVAFNFLFLDAPCAHRASSLSYLQPPFPPVSCIPHGLSVSQRTCRPDVKKQKKCPYLIVSN